MHTLSSLVVALPLALGLCGSNQSDPARSPEPSAASGAPRPAAQTPPVNAGPIIPDPESVDFGIVGPDTTVSATIKLRNTLNQAVTIKKAQPSCQCTTVDMDGKVIPAGGEIEMPMSMKTSRAVGKKAASVRMIFDGVTELVEVKIFAEVAYSIRAVPPFIDALAPERMKGTFELTSVDGSPFRILSVQGQRPTFVGFDPATDEATSHYTLAYDFTDPGERVPPYLLVETDRDDCPVLDLRVRHESTRIAPALRVAEFRSNAGRIAPGSSGSFDLEIKHMGSARVTGVRSLSPDASVRLADQTADGDSVLIAVDVTPRADFRGVLFFPIEISAGATSCNHLVYGVVR